MTEYRETKLSHKRLVIPISPDDIMIHNLRDEVRHMGQGIPKEKYWAFFTEHFHKYIKQNSTFADVWVPKMSPQTNVESRSLAF